MDQALSFFETAWAHYKALAPEAIRYYSLAGSSFRLASPKREMLDLLTPALSHLEVTPCGWELEVCIWDGGGLSFPWSERHYDLRGEVIQYNSDRICAVKDVHTGALYMLDKERKVALYWIEERKKLPWWVGGSPLQLILHWWMGDKGLQLTHAAAVGRKNGGVVFAGKSGSGKSTTTFACMKGGLSYLSEDYCLLDEGEIHSVYNSAKIGDQTLGWFPEMAPHVTNQGRKGGDKAFLFHQQFQPEKILKKCPLKALCTLQFDERCFVEQIDPQEALRALAVSTMWQLTHSGPSTFKRLEKISRAVPCYRLHVGRDFSLIAKQVEALL